MNATEVPVLVVGGGAAGLSASIFLSSAGVEHLLVERRPGTSHLPKAHYVNQRTMEIYRQHGVADAIYAVGAPIERMGTIVWCTSLGGDGPFDRVCIGEMDAFGGGSLRETYEADGAVSSTNLPQLRLEPILKDQAERRAPGRIRFGHELVGFTETGGGMVATVRDGATDEQYEVTARFLVAADGGRFIGPKLGVQMEGPTNLARLVSVHFRGDLSEYVTDDWLISWLVDPNGMVPTGTTALVKMGPTWDRHSQEWTAHLGFSPESEPALDEAGAVARIKALLKVDVDVEVLKISYWVLDRIVADRWQVGRTFIVGDAAHRQPPTSGLGLNTAVQDVHNLAWKLGEVVHGRAGEGLLDSYEAERKPVSTLGADWALLAYGNHALTGAGLGLSPMQPVEMNQANFAAYLSDTPLGRTLRARAKAARDTQRLEFAAHDIEVGFVYETGALVPDGAESPTRDPMGSTYSPNTRPGSRLPHAWLTSGTDRVSTHDLVRVDGGFVLITGVAGEDWAGAAKSAAETHGVPLRVARIGDGGEFADADGNWARLREIADGGAVLVRPDNMVAWRCHDAVPDATGALSTALRTVLGR